MNRQNDVQVLFRLLIHILERVAFVVVVSGFGAIWFAWEQTDTFWRPLFLNIGSNMIVFAFLFWIFQYFIGRQPGKNEDFPLAYYNALVDHPPIEPDNDHVSSIQLAKQNRRANAPMYEDEDQASLS